MKRLASLHLRDDKVYVSSASQTKDGFWIDTGTVHVADADDHDVIAAAIRQSLEESRHGVTTPPPYEDLTGPLRVAANVKSWQTFVKRARCVNVSASEGVAQVTPYRKVTKIGNYEPIPEKTRTVRLASSELGAIVMETFGDAT